MKNKISLFLFTQLFPVSVSTNWSPVPQFVDKLERGGRVPLMESELLPWPVRNEVRSNWSKTEEKSFFDVPAAGGKDAAKTGSLVVCVCQRLIPHPRRNEPADELRLQRQNLNTSAWETRRLRRGGDQLGSCVSPLTREGRNARAVGQTQRWRWQALSQRWRKDLKHMATLPTRGKPSLLSRLIG